MWIRQQMIMLLSSGLSAAFAFSMVTAACALPPLKKVIDSVSGQTGKPKPPQFVKPRDKWALIIGVGQFKDPTIAPLRFADKNVSQLAQMLVDPNVGRFASDHVVAVSDAQATEANLRTHLTDSWLTKKPLPGDMIVVYLCGRAQLAKDGTDVLLLAYDTAAQDAGTTGVPLKQVIGDLRKRTQCRNIICLLDMSPLLPKTAQSGQAAESVRPSSGLFWQQMAQDDKVTVLSGSEALLPSYENPMVSGSLFSHYLLDGLRTGGGLMNLEAIAQYMSQSIPADARNLLSKSQTPQFIANPENTDIAKMALGMPGQVAITPKTYNVGHPVDTLALSRPDLFRPRKPGPQEAQPDRIDEDDEDDDAGVSENVDFGPWMSKMKKDIQVKWVPPKGFEERKIIVVFTILRDGKIIDPQLVEGSGNEAVDQSALDALKAASPLDPLPKGARKSIQIRYQFDWRVIKN